MRQYRGVRIDNGEWVRGHHFRVGCRHFIISLHCVLMDMYPIIRDFIEVNPDTVGQYSGINAKIGGVICEGDKLKRANGSIDTVVFDGGSYCVKHENGDIDLIASNNGFEIIGTIHDKEKP